MKRLRAPLRRRTLRTPPQPASALLPGLSLGLRLRAVLLATCSSLLAGTVQAAGMTATIDAGGGMWRLIFSLLLVAGLLAGALYLLKKLHAPRGGMAALLRVISGAAVGTRERVVIVEVGETWLVLGVAAGQITKLHELPRQTLATAPAALPEKNFADWLRQIMDRRNAHKSHK